MSRKCARCGGKAYAAEERLGLNQSWHERCFTCAICNRTLDSVSLAENHELNEIYCKLCYLRNFAPRGYGYGPNEPTLLALPPASLKKSWEFVDGSKTVGLPEKKPSKNPLETKNRQRYATDKAKVTPDTDSFLILQPPCHSIEKSKESFMNATVSITRGVMTPLESLQVFKPCSLATKVEKFDRGMENINSGLHQPHNLVKAHAHHTQTTFEHCIHECEKAKSVTPNYPAKPQNNSRTPLYEDPAKENMEVWKSYKSINPLNVKPNAGIGFQVLSDNKTVLPHQHTGAANHNLGGGEPCRRCQKPVFWAEMKISCYGVYHQECFTCCCCGKPLESTTMNESQGEIFCKGCYRRYFGAHGCGYGIGAGALQTP